ncbi:site-specific integrase [Herbiconiux sp. VKM Ac-1786]|uniref:site-specific integrase n=1 Tax=Herbiconiux sp. VKM Ac-1786 TaxID=2783824 RepID=UPI00351C0641
MAGSITPYDTTAGKRYRVRYRKPDKSQTDKRGFRTKREAELFLASVTVSKALGDYIDPALSRVTVGDLAPRWLASKKFLKPSSVRPLETAWMVHVASTWEHREISSIVPSEVQAWVGELSSRRSPTVVIRAHGILAGILDTAVADRRLPRNPARGVSLPRKTGKAQRAYLTHDQVHTLAATSAYPSIVLCLAYTGLRWGELTALRVRHVNALRRRLHVEENAVKVGPVIHVGTPKGHEKRSVPYPPFVGLRLAELCTGKGPSALVFGDGSTHINPPRQHQRMVRRSGAPLSVP